MNAGLGGEGALADIGRMAVRRAVEHFVQRARGMRQRRRAARRGRRSRSCRRNPVFSFSVGIIEHEVGIAAALAEAVQRALNLPHAGAHRRQRIGHRLLGIVMGMDAEMIAGNDAFVTSRDDLLDFVRQRAAVGVAQHDPARPAS